MIRRWGAVEQMVSDGTLPTSEGRRLFAHSFEALTPAGDFSWSAYGTGTGAVFGVDTSQNPHAGKMIILNAGDLIGAFGDLNGSYGYSSSTAALGLGDYGTAEALTIDATNGVRFLNSSGTAVLQMTGGLFYLSGEIRVGDTGTPGVDFNGIRIYKSGATYRAETQNAGSANCWMNENGLNLAAGAASSNTIEWINAGDANHVGVKVYGDVSGGAYLGYLRAFGSSANDDARAWITAISSGDSGTQRYTRVECNSPDATSADVMIHVGDGATYTNTYFRSGRVDFVSSAAGNDLSLYAPPTEELTIVDAGSAAASEQDWIEVTVGGATGYIRVYAAK